MPPSRSTRREFLKHGTALAGAAALGGVALAEGPQSPPRTLRLATFRCDVTPPLGTPIYSSYRPLSTVEHPLLAKGIVLDDGAGRYALCAVDYCELCNSTHLLFRRKIAEAAGTDVSKVAVQTVHQHTAPMADADADRILAALEDPPPYPDPKLYDEAAGRLAEAVRQAAARLEPFDQVGTGEAKVERVASSRRCRTPDGKIAVRWSSCKDPELRAMPEGLIDPMLKTITFARDGKPLARLHYYATHPQSFYGDPRASYDFPGMARERLEAAEKVFQVYFTGCGGDITAGKYNDGSREARDGLADRLFAGMEAAAKATRYGPAGPVAWRTTPLALTPRSDPGFTEADYRRVMTDRQAAPSSRIYGGAMALALLARAKEPIELSSLTMGRVSLVHLPGEPMIEFQRFAQRERPDALVAVAGYGDCCYGYVCTEAAFQEGGYEPTDSLVVPESEKAVKEAISRLLGRTG